jgi:hypothetical protein
MGKFISGMCAVFAAMLASSGVALVLADSDYVRATGDYGNADWTTEVPESASRCQVAR